MAFQGQGHPSVCGSLFAGPDLGPKFFCLPTNSSSAAAAGTSAGLGAAPVSSVPAVDAGAPRNPAALAGGGPGGGAATVVASAAPQQPQHIHPGSEAPNAADLEPDRPIGYGAFGVVWSVTDPRDGKRVALKKMPNVFQNLVSCKRVFRELKMLCFFKHDNVSGLPNPPPLIQHVTLLCDGLR
ncbi:NLK kinase, partial [Polypterus senegalus]